MSKQVVYGYPCVINPHDFEPDKECCSPAELEAHRLAKANWGKPAFVPNKGCYSEHDASGRMVKHVTRTVVGDRRQPAGLVRRLQHPDVRRAVDLLPRVRPRSLPALLA